MQEFCQVSGAKRRVVDAEQLRFGRNRVYSTAIKSETSHNIDVPRNQSSEWYASKRPA